MQQIIFAMLAAGVFLAVRDMAKVIYEEKNRVWIGEMPQNRLLWAKAEAFQTLADTLGQQESEESSKTLQETVWNTFRARACNACAYRENCDKVGRIGRKKYAFGLIALMENNDWEQYEISLSTWLSWCSRGRETAQLLAYCMQEYYALQYQRKQVRQMQQATVMQLGEIAHMLKHSAREAGRYQPLGQRMRKQLKEAAYRRGILVGEVWFLEKDNRRICIYTMLKSRVHKAKKLQDILDILERQTGRHLIADKQQQQFIGEDYRLFSFSEALQFELLCGVSQSFGEREAMCGDSYSIFAGDGHVQLCLSDGMGSGKQAGRISETVVNLLEELINCGFSKETAYRMIHTSLLLQEQTDNYATLDICQVNLYTGICEFMKAGASASYILRKNTVESVALSALAPGLHAESDYEKKRVRLQNGDYIIMLTDGVSEAFFQNETDELPSVLVNMSCKVPKRMSEEILSAAKERLGEVRDDMTVLVAGVWDKQE